MPGAVQRVAGLDQLDAFVNAALVEWNGFGLLAYWGICGASAKRPAIVELAQPAAAMSATTAHDTAQLA